MTRAHSLAIPVMLLVIVLLRGEFGRPAAEIGKA
jgi:hypothetical protein